MGTKPDDSRALPFADWLHRLYHTIGKKAFAKCYGIDYEQEIRKYNALYLRAKPRGEYKKAMRVKLHVFHCEACKQDHEIPIDKTQMVARRFQCVVKNQWVTFQ